MKLWLLSRGSKSVDEAYGFVVRAKTEADARLIAAENCGDEGHNVWLQTKKSTCEQLSARGDREMILRDFNAG